MASTSHAMNPVKPFKILEVYLYSLITFVVAIVVVNVFSLLPYYTKYTMKPKYPQMGDTSLDEYIPLIYHHSNHLRRSMDDDDASKQRSNESTIENDTGKHFTSPLVDQDKQNNVKSRNLLAGQKAIETASIYPEQIRERNSNMGEGKIHWIAVHNVQHLLLRHRLLNMQMSTCFTYNNCKLIFVKSLRNIDIEPDAVIFEGRNMPKILPNRNDENQVYIYADLTPPILSHQQNLHERKRLFNYFNYSMTYRLDSTFPILNGAVVTNSAESSTIGRIFETEGFLVDTFKDSNLTAGPKSVRKDYSHVFQRKQKGLVTFMAQCITPSKREKYVDEMKRYIDIDVISDCSSSNLDICSNKSRHECDSKISSVYKFYLAFENAFCDDYISREVFSFFERDIILVVRGGGRYEQALPEGTYISTESFLSPNQLALYLSELGSSEMRYTEILRRKDRYKTLNHKRLSQMTFCNLCYRLNNINRYKYIIKDIHSWWNENSCKNASDI